MPKIIQKDKLNQTLLIQLLPKIRSGDLFKLNTDEIAKLLNISKATLYRVYPNKEAIFENFVSGMIEFLKIDKKINLKQTKRNNEEFEHVFFKLFVTELIISNDFLEKLKINNPILEQKITNSLNQQDKKIIEFYVERLNNNQNVNVNPRMLLIQQQATLQYMLNPKRMINGNISIREFITSFYQLQLKVIGNDSNKNDSISPELLDKLMHKLEETLF